MTQTRQGEILLEEGVVLAVSAAADREPARATVRLEAGDHCEGCPARVTCRPTEGDRRVMDVLDPVGVAVGDRVRVAVPGGAVLKASFLVYGLPLVLLLAGVGAGAAVLPADQPLRDLWSFLMGVALAAAAVPWVRRTVQRLEAGGGRVLPARIEAKLAATAAESAE